MEQQKKPRSLEARPLTAIREKCIDCCCGSVYEVEKCTAERCPLWPWRFGKNPYKKKREYTEEQREALRESARRLNEQKKAAKLAAGPADTAS